MSDQGLFFSNSFGSRHGTPATGAVVGPAANAQAALERPPVGNPTGRSAGARLSEIVEKWHQDQEARGIWTVDQTWTNTYGPALRVFRELIAREQRIPESAANAIWDIRIGDIDRDGGPEASARGR